MKGNKRHAAGRNIKVLVVMMRAKMTINISEISIALMHLMTATPTAAALFLCSCCSLPALLYVLAKPGLKQTSWGWGLEEPHMHMHM
jgi:hypothetical protein